MKLRSLVLLLLVVLPLCSVLHAQAVHAPVAAGSSNESTGHDPETDSARYKAAQERDRENIRKALQSSRENLDAVRKPAEDLRIKKLIGKMAVYAIFGIVILVAYRRKKRKPGTE